MTGSREAHRGRVEGLLQDGLPEGTAVSAARTKAEHSQDRWRSSPRLWTEATLLWALVRLNGNMGLFSPGSCWPEQPGHSTRAGASAQQTLRAARSTWHRQTPCPGTRAHGVPVHAACLSRRREEASGCPSSYARCRRAWTWGDTGMKAQWGACLLGRAHPHASTALHLPAEAVAVTDPMACSRVVP